MVLMYKSFKKGSLNYNVEALQCYECSFKGCGSPFSSSASGVSQVTCPTSGVYSCGVRLEIKI